MDRIITAGLAQLDEVARLFDLYRQFYQQPPDLQRARDYIEARMKGAESTIFLAEAAAPIYVLYDLYVDAPARRTGIGRALMLHAQKFARDRGAVRMQLETAIDNLPGQGLYESLGWQRDTAFYSYALGLR